MLDFYIYLSFRVTWLWTWHKCQLWRVSHQSCMGLIYFILIVGQD